MKADHINMSINQQQTTDEWSLRFPRFLRFRGFEPGEKL
jgi:hypothetical protein